MPSTAYRRKLRSQQEIPIPISSFQDTPRINKIPIQSQSTQQSCNSTFDSITKQMYDTLDVFIDLTDFADVKKRCEEMSNTLAPYSEYFTILDRIESHINAIARHTIQPIDISVIQTEIHSLRTELRSLPPICPESAVITARISGLITFINKTLYMDTFEYSLKVTLDKIQTSLQSMITIDKKLEEIYRVILEIFENIKDEKPTNVIQWRVRYVKRAVDTLLNGRDDLTWAV